ncbi:MAG TPA: DNA gyrase subunit A [Chitinophagales bacterium]|nr:DNA gyrase subunit A [Chitinophagales bacterium]
MADELNPPVPPNDGGGENPDLTNTPRIIPINIEEEMKTAYIDYSMSVIVSRAIPDVRDGLKPVHRRVLYAMNELGLAPNKPHKKSARIVGEVLGKYHPHGDSSVYDAMVRMAQDWSLRYPLVDGQGNFGSIDDDPPAAMRYTEARFRKMAEDMLADIEKDTVDMRLNFDDSLEEPSVLPSKIPNLLVNGASGIAVGMATNMLPHNLTEVADGVVKYIDNKDVTIEELMTVVKAPDFPTGGTIYGYDGVRQAFMTGRGRVVLRGKAEIEVQDNGREWIIISEVPYQVVKSDLVRKIAELGDEKKIEGISEVRDESDRNGIRVVIELRRDAISNVVLNQLFALTSLQTSFGVNNVAIVNGIPKILNLKDFIRYFVEFRHDVVVRRAQWELKKALERAHILEGLLIALDHLDEVIKLIRASNDSDIAREGLMSNFGLSEIQAKAILEMRLSRLTGLEREKIRLEYDELMKTIAWLNRVLAEEPLRMEIIRNETLEIKEKYGDERRTNIEYAAGDFNMEDLIANDEVVVTISHLGYIKRTPSAEYKTQNRGGRGSKGSAARDEDFIEHMFLATNHNYILFFTQLGRCFWLKVYEIPEGEKTGKGRAIQNLISIPKEDKIMAYIPVNNLTDENYLTENSLIFCTKRGTIKKTTLKAYSNVRAGGVNAIEIREGDELVQASLTNEKQEVIIATKAGKAIRFPINEETVRAVGRNSMGVRGVTLEDDKDEVIGMVTINPANPTETIMVLSEKGYGKRSNLTDPETKEEIYRITNRGGKGVKTLNITDKTGSLSSILNVTDNDHVMIINKSGIAIRLAVDQLRVMGRAAQGVRVIKLNEKDQIAAVAKIENGKLSYNPEEDGELGKTDDTAPENTEN